MQTNPKPISKSKQKRGQAEVIFAVIVVISVFSFFMSVNVISLSETDNSLNQKNIKSMKDVPKRKIVSKGKDETRYFMVFSTSCSPLQHWQSLLFFYFAHKVKQPGNITRIVSGCSSDEADALRKVHREKISSLSDRFNLHVTPDYGFRDNKKYWNKPHGLLHWFENELKYQSNSTRHDDDIIIILDPDMLLLKPITNDFGDFEDERFWIGGRRSEAVSHMVPFAQQYGFGNAWLTSLKGKLSDVVGKDSPALKVTLKQANTYYPAGPPYLATGKDMFALATHWVKFLPKVHRLFPQFMAEMHAYSVAAAHLEMPHQLTKAFMVSDVAADRFRFLDNVSRAQACNANIPASELPFVLHYCQRYAIGRWFFSKYKLHENVFDCEAELLREPPLNVAELYDWYIFPNGIEKADYSAPGRQQNLVKNGWMMCNIIFSLNEAATQMKKTHCHSEANYNKTFHFHDSDAFEAMLTDFKRPF